MITPTNQKQERKGGRPFKRRKKGNGSKKGNGDKAMQVYFLQAKLLEAIRQNNLESVQSTLRKYEEGGEDCGLDRFPTLLHTTASLSDRPKILHYLIDKGAEVDAFHDGLTPLMVAVQSKKYENVRVLLETKSRSQYMYQKKVTATLMKLNSSVFPVGVASVISEMICPIGASVELRDPHHDLTPLDMANWSFGGQTELAIRDLLLSQMTDVWPDYLQKGGQPAPFQIHWGDREVVEDEY